MSLAGFLFSLSIEQAAGNEGLLFKRRECSMGRPADGMIGERGSENDPQKKIRYSVESNHLRWTNRESNPGPLPDIVRRIMLREYYTTKPFARLLLWLELQMRYIQARHSFSRLRQMRMGLRD
ncbi:hypothetical protein B0J13DRAFT_554614 [Dactylonectria estremocensis]|uniref:Uncharacterized protein n=1 Tax=Dactylonectria estremocensis TaxID=1079267 RepID=A0A9P9ERZ6_9HYPO|nr:hypothetical protein B0J13DRAFT_554614 [Dactylonectria estremocensis]